jgi:hypothetical protein
LVQAWVAWSFGLIDLKQRWQAEAMQNQVVDLVRVSLIVDGAVRL